MRTFLNSTEVRQMLPINALFQNEQKMNHKTWLPWKRFIEDGISKKGNEKEKLPNDKEEALKETIKNLHEQVACLLCECDAKDELMAEHDKTAQEAIIGRENAEEKLAIWKQELEEVLQQNIAANERLFHLNGELNNCRQEQDRRVNLERAYKKLETKYTEARQKLASLTIENAQLTKSVAEKDELIEATADYHVLKRELKMRTLHADMAKRISGHAKIKPKAVNKRTSVMIKRLCEMEEENKTLKEIVYQKENEICVLKLKAEVAGNNNHLESENKIGSLKKELERLNEHFESLKLINIDLDQKLSSAKVENKEVLEKVSVLEMELEDRCQHYEGLETRCLELQLQLATVSKDEDFEEDGKQAGLDIDVSNDSFEYLITMQEISCKEVKSMPYYSNLDL